MEDTTPEPKAKRLSRRDLAEALTNAGFPISHHTLATMATRGGGPRYVRFNGKVLYDLDVALAWAEARVSQVAAE
jgi:hypothetical protein